MAEFAARGTLSNTTVYIGYIDHRFRRDSDFEGLEISGGDLTGQWLGGRITANELGKPLISASVIQYRYRRA